MSDDRRPHSRACGWKPHDHGTACHPNCPTCGSVFAPAAAVPEAEDGREADDEAGVEWPSFWTVEQKCDDIHARYHGQKGNMLGEDECGWEHCQVWEAFRFALRLAPFAAARDDERERLAVVLALRELVRLKDLKDRIDAPDGNEWSSAYYAARADYRENKPKAWAAARAALAAAPLPEGQEGT